MLGWTSPADGSCAQHREFMVGWVHRVLGNLGRCLARPEWQRTIEAYGARVEAG